jgi:CCR4-NOT transcription complex subunit 2
MLTLSHSTRRNWRYHKSLQIWLTKDRDFPDPLVVSPDMERGRYIVWNPKDWVREQVSFSLDP